MEFIVGKKYWTWVEYLDFYRTIQVEFVKEDRDKWLICKMENESDISVSKSKLFETEIDAYKSIHLGLQKSIEKYRDKQSRLATIIYEKENFNE